MLHAPVFDGNELQYVSQCVSTGWVSSVGSFVTRFEEMLREITGVQRVVACSNGTSALFLALKLAGVETGDEVLVPALTFVATANAVSHCGAVPYLVDSEPVTLGIDCAKLRSELAESTRVVGGHTYSRKTGRRISAIVPMHCFGHPCAMDEIVSLAEEFRLQVVEDAAESLGSTRDGRHAGTFGRVSIMSFNGNKIVTTGGGGAILTNDADLGDRAKHLTTTAKVPHAWKFYHDEVGYNLRMPNLNAALGCGQLEQLDRFIAAKRDLASRYIKAFRDVDGVSAFEEPRGCRSNYWLNAILLDATHVSLRDAMLKETNEGNIMTRPAWELLHQLPMFRSCPRVDLSQAESIQSRLINIPSGVSVAERHSQIPTRGS
ncbi:Putative pyridoxal phosphate-dependent aminotransferase EpsN [Stieleria neptunia]|uniref:GDP-perosamine synthase n=2 Tax=Stieleria neptunia TaxID=2527979 RepID=A0A518HTQ5_9BACT|nr:Putative pyridoxal phosphate-dependent aminotransferase EpsN [Stieleria neptunia]